MKIKAKAKDCQLTVKVKVSFGENIDTNELERFKRIYLREFLKPEEYNNKQIIYSGPVGISLYERLKKPISKKDFLFIVEHIVIAVQKLCANTMPLNYLMMDMQQIFVNEHTKEVFFLYVPISNRANNASVINLIETIIYSLRPTDETNNDFVAGFLYNFRAIKPFDLSKVEGLIASEDRSVVNTVRKQNIGQSGFITDKQKDYYKNKKHEDSADEQSTDLLTDDEQTDMLDDYEKTGRLIESGINSYEDDDCQTGKLDEDCEETGRLIDGNTNVHYPVLFRTLTNEKISINKPVFRLGKEKSYVDYFVTNNNAVSRGHADIIIRGNCCFVKDLNSKNHTYINGRELPVCVEIEIHDGDHLKLGNEEFIFSA